MAAIRRDHPMVEAIHARVSMEERQLFERAARKRGQTLADFMRDSMTFTALSELGQSN